MRFLAKVLVVMAGTVLLIAGGRSPDHAATPSQSARAATVVGVQQPTDAEQRENEPDGADTPATGADADRARRAAEAAVSGATAREVERETGDDDQRASAWEVELVRPDGATVEVDLDAGFKVLATDRDDDRRNDD
jgi:uncharacterized membrane protein YkoI